MTLMSVFRPINQAFGLFLSLVLTLLIFGFQGVHAATPKAGTNFKLGLDAKASDEFIGTVSVDAKRLKVHFLRDSYLYNLDYGDRRSLYGYIIRLPSMYDAESKDAVYALNFRGINTTPTKGLLPINIIADGLVTSERYRSPRHVYLLPYIEYLEASETSEELRSGPQGVVSLTSSQPSLNFKGEFVLMADSLQQKALLRLVGALTPKILYGINANFTTRRGVYTNASTKSFEEGNGSPFDKESSIYLNTYIILDHGILGQTRPYFNYTLENRGFIRGEQLDYETLLDPNSKDRTVDEINKSQTANVDSLAKNSTLILGVDGMRNHKFFQHSYGISLEKHQQNNRQDINRSDGLIPNLGIEGATKDSYNDTALNLSYSIAPALASLSFRYRLAAELHYEREDAPNIQKGVTLEASSAILDRGSINFDYQYKQDLVDLSLLSAMRYYLSSRSFFDVMFTGKFYGAKLSQESQIKTEKDGKLYFDVLNKRLALTGLRGFNLGVNDYDATYSNMVLLPDIEWTFQHRLNLLNRQNYFIRYYEGYQPGGINPYVIRDTSRRRAVYKPERYRNLEVGLRGHYNGGLILMDLKGYYIDMRNIQYVSSRDALEIYYGNNQGGSSTGLEFSYRQEFLPNFEWYFQADYKQAKYRGFVHELYSNGSASPQKSFDYTGNTIINTPKYSMLTYLAYSTLSGWYLRGEYQHFGPMYFDYANLIKNKSYGILNFALGWENKNFALEAYAKNALNKRYVRAVLPNPYNETGQALEDICHAGLCHALGTNFEWQNTALKSYGDGLTVGLTLGLRN